MNKTRYLFTILLLNACAGDFKPDLMDTGMGSTDTSDGSTGSDTSSTATSDGSTGDGTGSTGDETDGSTSGATDSATDTGSSGETGTPDGCGDGEAKGMEECDGLDLRGMQCSGLAAPMNGNFHSGTLACHEDCTYDTTACNYCGDAIQNDASEDCDDADLDGATCQTEGWDGGDLSCDTQCGFDESACKNCQVPMQGSWYSLNGCGGTTLSTASGSICTKDCMMDADCPTDNLEVCEVQPVCYNSYCHLDCSGGKECPQGMTCGPYGGNSFCFWK